LQSRRIFGRFSSFFYTSLLAGLEFFSRYLVGQLAVIWTAALWQREVGGLEKCLVVMFADFILVPEASYVVGNVGP
jgi:hypothetical protein